MSSSSNCILTSDTHDTGKSDKNTNKRRKKIGNTTNKKTTSPEKNRKNIPPYEAKKTVRNQKSIFAKTVPKSSSFFAAQDENMSLFLEMKKNETCNNATINNKVQQLEHTLGLLDAAF